MLISVIVSNFNGARYLPKLLESFRAQQGVTLEIIIVDRRIYGLPFYLDAPLERLARRPERVPEYQPTTEPWDEEVGELSQVTYRHVFVVPRRLYPAFAERVAAQAAPCRAEVGHGDLRLIVCEPAR